MATKLPRISYEDKIDYRVEGKDDKTKISAKDMNEIKHVFNESAQAIEKSVDDVEIAYQNLGDCKVENGFIYFKKADGTWNDEGVEIAGQTTISLDETVQTNLKLSSERSNKDKIFVQLLDSDGNPIMIETDSSNIYKKSKDGTSEITLDVLDTTLAKLINSISFFDVNPIPLLTELSKYLDIE